MNKLVLTVLASFLIVGCSSNIDRKITLVKGETTAQEVENELGSPTATLRKGKVTTYEYTSSHLGRDITTGLILGWQFLDNHILTLCDKGKANCKVFSAKDGEDAKSLNVEFVNNVVKDAYLVD